MKNLFELTPKQKAAFDKLKKAYKACEKLSIGFYNNYGTIGAIDIKKITEYDDQKDDNAIMDSGQNCLNEFRSVDSWADDTHYFHPVKY